MLGKVLDSGTQTSANANIIDTLYKGYTMEKKVVSIMCFPGQRADTVKAGGKCGAAGGTQEEPVSDVTTPADRKKR